MRKYLYIEVTKDEFELPVAVADTIEELAKLRRVRPSSICTSIKMAEKNDSRTKYKKVEVTE